MSAPSGPSVERAAAVAFLTALDDACAERLVPIPGGHAVVDSRHARLWDANHLRVEAAEPPDADALLAAAERHQAQLGFRAIHVLDPQAGAALEAPLTAAGCEARHDLLMLLEQTPPPLAQPPQIVELPVARIAPTMLAAAGDHGFDAEVGRQLASRAALVADRAPTRWLAVLAAGDEIAARCQLLGGDGPVAQIENVYTAPQHRSRGHARALVTHAAHAARAAGASTVFLRTDAADTPQRLYRRLGFADAGLLPRFLGTL